MADVKWIKITTNVFDNRKIRMIEKMPEGDAIIIIWFKVLCLAGTINDDGMIMFTPEIPYTEEMIASQFDRPISIIRLAFQTFIRFGMLEVIDNILRVSNWEKYQNIEGMEKIRQQTRKRVSAYRERKKLGSGEPEKDCNNDVSKGSNVTVTQGNATDIDKNKNKHKYGEFQNVLLTDVELEKLQKEYPETWKDSIDFLSIWIEEKSYKSKSHYLAIRRWVNDAVLKKKPVEQKKSEDSIPWK